MIHDGFIYLATLMLLAAILVNLPVYLRGKGAQTFFKFAPPIVLIYLGMMLLCTMKVWDLKDTSAIYVAIKNPLLYAMLFLMLLRCDLKKIIKLGPKMLIGFFSASISIGVGFVVSYGIFHKLLGPESWKALAALCGSWLGGGSNMLAIQAILDVSEESLAYSLVMDSVCAVIYVMFLLWVINFSKEFNSWTKADVRLIDEVGASLEKEAREDKRPLTWKNMLLLIGVSFFISSLSKDAGVMVASVLPVFDKATWTVLLVTATGLIVAMTPFGKIKGTEEVSNIMLYIVIAMIASRADISDPADPCSGYGNPCKADPTGYLYLCGCISGEYRRNCDSAGTCRCIQQRAGSDRYPDGPSRQYHWNTGRRICRILNEPDWVENNNS